jgi:hypothetical protein
MNTIKATTTCASCHFTLVLQGTERNTIVCPCGATWISRTFNAAGEQVVETMTHPRLEAAEPQE